jgi:hypothetical protein
MLGLDEVAFRYLKRRLTNLNPALMMARVPVCPTCLKHYSQEHSGKQRPNPAKNSVVRINQPMVLIKKVVLQTTSSVPVIRARAPAYQIGDITPSGLRVVAQGSSISLGVAARLYHRPPFLRPLPPLRDPDWKYEPPSVDAKN